jgi:imidazolonepropionase-like amidohydrolase
MPVGGRRIKNAIRADPPHRARHLPDDEAINLCLSAGRTVATLVAPQGVPDAAARGPVPGRGHRKGQFVIETHRGIRAAVEARVRIAMGTDSGVTPHGRTSASWSSWWRAA